jgi:nicotinate-nucleotide adenylyltransferase
MRRLCFGGSFNPIHHGHLLCARAAAEAKGYQQVVLIPSAVPPHKLQASGLVTAPQRLEMCRLAVAGDPFFAVDDLELTRAGPSYTIDTAREFRRRGWDHVDWLIGADMLPGLTTWHRAPELLKEVTFVVMTRPGQAVDRAAMSRVAQELPVQMVEVPLVEISATSLRRRVAEGLPIRYLAPDPVCAYIASHGLYR